MFQENIWESEESQLEASADESAEKINKSAVEELYTMRLRARPPKKDYSDYMSAADSDGNQPPLPPQEEFEISSRGRIRKRRIIPNNVEDQGIKRRRILRDVSPTSAQNIQKSIKKPAKEAELMSSAIPVHIQENQSMLTTAQLLQHLQSQQQKHGGSPTTLSMFTSGGKTFLITAPIQSHNHSVLQSPPSESSSTSSVRIQPIATAGSMYSMAHHLKIKPRQAITSTALQCLRSIPQGSAMTTTGLATDSAISFSEGTVMSSFHTTQNGSPVKCGIPLVTAMSLSHPTSKHNNTTELTLSDISLQKSREIVLGTPATNTVTGIKALQPVLGQAVPVGSVPMGVIPVKGSPVGSNHPQIVFPTVIQHNEQQLNLTNVPKNIIQQLINSQTIQQVKPNKTVAYTTLSTQQQHRPTVFTTPASPLLSSNPLCRPVVVLPSGAAAKEPTTTCAQYVVLPRTITTASPVTITTVSPSVCTSPPVAPVKLNTMGIKALVQLKPALLSQVDTKLVDKRQKGKYANNITVKELLEVRANSKQDHLGIMENNMVLPLQSSKAVNKLFHEEVPLGMVKPIGAEGDSSGTPHVIQKPEISSIECVVSKPPEQTEQEVDQGVVTSTVISLDALVNSVITSIPTTLPTMNVKFSGVSVANARPVTVNTPAVTVPLVAHPSLHSIISPYNRESPMSHSAIIRSIGTLVDAKTRIVSPTMCVDQMRMAGSGQCVRVVTVEGTPQTRMPVLTRRLSVPVSIAQPIVPVIAHTQMLSTNESHGMIGQPSLAGVTSYLPVKSVTPALPSVSTRIMAANTLSTLPRLSATIRAVSSLTTRPTYNTRITSTIEPRGPSQKELEEIAIHTLTSGFIQTSQSDKSKANMNVSTHVISQGVASPVTGPVPSEVKKMFAPHVPITKLPVTTTGQKTVLLRLAVPYGTNIDQLLQTTQMQNLQRQLSTQMRAQKAQICNVRNSTAASEYHCISAPTVNPIANPAITPVSSTIPIVSSSLHVPPRPIATKVVLPVNSPIQTRIVYRPAIQGTQPLIPHSASPAQIGEQHMVVPVNVSVSRTVNQQNRFPVQQIPRPRSSLYTTTVVTKVVTTSSPAASPGKRPATVAQLRRQQLEQQMLSPQVRPLCMRIVCPIQTVHTPLGSPGDVGASASNRMVLYNLPRPTTPPGITGCIPQVNQPSFVLKNGTLPQRPTNDNVKPIPMQPLQEPRLIGMPLHATQSIGQLMIGPPRQPIPMPMTQHMCRDVRLQNAVPPVSIVSSITNTMKSTIHPPVLAGVTTLSTHRT